MSKKEAQKKSWFKGLKAEFRKIIWPDKETPVSYTHLDVYKRQDGSLERICIG